MIARSLALRGVEAGVSMLGLDDPAAGLKTQEVAFANARHTQVVWVFRRGAARLAGIRARLVGAGPGVPAAAALTISGRRRHTMTTGARVNPD